MFLFKERVAFYFLINWIISHFMPIQYNIVEIIRGTTVDGPGFRTSIYFAGCNHKCPGCHNPQTWDSSAGTTMTIEEIMEIVREEDFNVTLSGGDPLFFPAKTGILIDALKNDGRNVWVYTGYTWEEISANESLLNAIRKSDVLIDGRYDKSLQNTDLLFRGSSNQRLIDVKKSLESNIIIKWERPEV